MLVIILILSLSLLQLAQATILITQPARTTFQKNQIKYWYSNFGEIHYNKPAIFQLVVLDTGLCGNDSDAKIKHYTKPTYVVVNGDLSQCSFPTRALIAQDLGAAGIIFASRDINYAMGNVVISDDGHGRKVNINALFIAPDTYTQLQKLKNINIKVKFPIVTRDKSDVTLFIQSSTHKMYIFLRDFRPYYESIKKYINLNLVYHTFSCQYCQQNQCVLQNKCCAFDFQHLEFGVGRHIVKQQFRQFNVFNYAVSKKDIGKWFDYMNQFDHNCDTNWVNSEKCAGDILKDLGITDNMNIADESSIMMEWRRLQTKIGVISYPDLAVNGLKHDETLTPVRAFEMICSSLNEPPAECLGQDYISASPNRTGLIVGLVIMGVLLIILGIFCYRKIVKRQITNDMSSRVSELVAKYAAKVSDQKKKRKEKLMQKITEQL